MLEHGAATPRVGRATEVEVPIAWAEEGQFTNAQLPARHYSYYHGSSAPYAYIESKAEGVAKWYKFSYVCDRKNEDRTLWSHRRSSLKRYSPRSSKGGGSYDDNTVRTGRYKILSFRHPFGTCTAYLPTGQTGDTTVRLRVDSLHALAAPPTSTNHANE